MRASIRFAFARSRSRCGDYSASSRSIRPSTCLANRPSLRGCTGSRLRHGHELSVKPASGRLASHPAWLHNQPHEISLRPVSGHPVFCRVFPHPRHLPRHGGGHGGHNGLRDIVPHLGADFHRLRVGIGHPGHKDKVAPYVLSDFAKAEQDWLEDLLRGISDGAAFLAEGNDAKFMNAVALRTAPPRSSSSARPAAAEPAPAKADPAAAPEKSSASLLQRLAERFRS